MSSLFTYQQQGADWLASKSHGLLADEMGLGKTVQAIRAAETIRAKRILVVCPAVARINWAREFRKWSGLGAVIDSFEMVTRHPGKFRGPWDVLVIDESHFAKSLGAKRTAAILGKEGLVHQATRTWLLSGTPAPNHAGELWPMLYTFGVTRLKFNDYVDRYCDTIDTGYGTGQKIVGTKRAMIPELRGLLSRFMLRRRKADVLKDLPPIFFQDITVEPGRVELPSADRLRLEEEIAILGMKLETSQDEIRVLEALAGSVSTLRRYTGLQKLEPAAELVSGELELGLLDKIVVFAIHKDVVSGLHQRLRKWGAVVVSGSTRPSDRQAAVDAFQRDPNVRVFIGNIQAAGTALTLTAANHVLIVEPDWVPGNNAQAAMRCHRIGQDKPVTVRFLSLSNPIDERVNRVLKRKSSELSKLFEPEG